MQYVEAKNRNGRFEMTEKMSPCCILVCRARICAHHQTRLGMLTIRSSSSHTAKLGSYSRVQRWIAAPHRRSVARIRKVFSKKLGLCTADCSSTAWCVCVCVSPTDNWVRTGGLLRSGAKEEKFAQRAVRRQRRPQIQRGRLYTQLSPKLRTPSRSGSLFRTQPLKPYYPRPAHSGQMQRPHP